MANLTRRDALRLTGSFALSLSFAAPAPASTRSQNDDAQSQWVLDALAQQRGGFAKLPRLIIVDKHKAMATAYEAGRPVFSMGLLLGESKRDVLIAGKSVFAQKTTPAGYFDRIDVIFDPDVSNKYHRQMLVGFTPPQAIGNKFELLAFHSILAPQDAPNLGDGNSRNNYLSNGCIRLNPAHLDYLLTFCLQDKKAFLNTAPQRGRRVTMPCDMTVVVMPQEDRSKANTLKMTGLDGSAAAPQASQPQPRRVPALTPLDRLWRSIQNRLP